MRMGNVMKGLSMLAIPFLLAGCTKEPGEGGSGEIKGTVYSKSIYDSSKEINPEEFEPDQEVYISYGEKNTYNEKTRTGSNGAFVFKNLTPGKYRIFSYSMDPSTKGTVSVVKTVELSGAGSIAEVKNFLIHKLPTDGGTAMITGQLRVKNHDANGVYLYENYKAGEEVFISTLDGILIDRVRTSADGKYCFTGVRNGSYLVYSFSENVQGKVPDEFIISHEININQRNQQVNLPEDIVNRMIKEE